MKRSIRFFVAVVSVAMLSTAIALAGGYQIGEHGAKAMGMGGAFVAQASDASAIHFNPAGLAYQKGINVMLGATLIAPSSDFTPPGGSKTNMNSQTFYPPTAYVTYGMDNGLTFGIGLYAPYGLGTEWPSTWVGRYEAVKTDLQTFYINPSVAYMVTPEFSVGVGFSYIFGNVTLTQKINLPPPLTQASDWDSELSGTGNGFSFNVGILYMPTEQLSIGASYRSLATIEFEGDAKFTGVPNVPLPSPPYPPGLTLPALFQNQTGKTKLPMPADLRVGVAYDVTKDFLVEADFQYVFWDAYDKLTVEFDQGVGGETKIEDVKAYENSYLIRVGGQYSMDKLAIRAGFVYDMSPVPDKSLEPLLPDANRIEGVVGVGYQFSERVRVDAAYQFISASERTVADPPNSFPGTYNSTAHLFGLSLGLAF